MQSIFFDDKTVNPIQLISSQHASNDTQDVHLKEEANIEYATLKHFAKNPKALRRNSKKVRCI